VLLCPPAPVPAIPHDHGPDLHARRLSVDGEAHPGLQHPGDRDRGAVLPRTGDDLHAHRQAGRIARHRFFADHDVLLCPPAPVPAIPHDHGPDLHARRLSVGPAMICTPTGRPAGSRVTGATAAGRPLRVASEGPAADPHDVRQILTA
jgi:hypothetical protein